MTFIALFCPAAISVALYGKGRESKLSTAQFLSAYLIFALAVNLLTCCVFVYIFHFYDYTASSIDSFSFFIKYGAVAALFALILPSVYGMLGKFIKIRFDDQKEDGKKSKP